MASSQYDYSSDPFAAPEMDVTAQILAMLAPSTLQEQVGEDRSRSASPLAPDVLRGMKDQNRMQQGNGATLPPPLSTHFKTPPSTSQSALPMPAMARLPLPATTQTSSTARLPLPAQIASVAAPMDDDDPFADLMPSAQRPAAEASVSDADDPFADLIPAKTAAAASGPKASPLYDLVRSVGTGLRSGIESIPGMIGDVGMLVDKLGEQIARPIFGDEQVDAVLAQRKAETGTTMPTVFGMHPPTSADVNEATSKVIGPSYEPETTAGEYARTAGEFLPGSFLGPGSTASKAIRFGLIPAAASETAGQATEGTAAEPWARALGGLGGNLAASSVLGRRPLPTYDRLGKRTDPAGVREDIAAATERQSAPTQAGGRERIHLPEAAMPDNATQAWVAGKLGQVPFLGRPLQASAERTAKTMGARMEELATDLGGGSTSRARATAGAKDNLTRWVEETSANRLTAAYDAVDTLITDPKVTTPLSNTRQMMNTLRTEMDASTGHAADPAIALVAEATRRRGGLTYHGLKQLRTEIGDRISGKITPSPGTSEPALKRLYGALTEDLEASVRKAGGHRAWTAWNDANDLTRNIAREREALTKIVGVKGDASPEAVFNRLLNMASDTKMGANIEGLRDARQAVVQAAGGNPQAWQDIGAAALARMGRDPAMPADYFSPERFLTAHGKMSKHGRRLLFGPVVAGHMDDLSLVANRHKELMRRGNPSGTGGVVTGVSLLSGLYAAPLSTIATIVSGRTLASALARPAKAAKIVNWARARNGVLESRTARRLQTLTTASRELADDLAIETGGNPADITARLMGDGN